MEEQRQRQEDEQRRALAESDTGAVAAANIEAPVGGPIVEANSEEAMLQRALAMSTETVCIIPMLNQFAI